MATGSSNGNVWGTDIYTDDSILATAIVHAGFTSTNVTVITTVQILKGQNRYNGSSRHGIKSEHWGFWHGSYQIISATKLLCNTVQAD